MQYIKTIKSQRDATLKYIFKTKDNLVVEFSYINKDDGKDIICVPCQTMCVIGCKFCHTTDYIGKIPSINLDYYDIIEGIRYIYEDLDLQITQRVLLISFMGCGEPLLNGPNVTSTMQCLFHNADKFGIHAPLIRFAIATSMPDAVWTALSIMIDAIKKDNLPVKFHLSMHYTIDNLRKEWMPHSMNIIPALSLMDFYKKYTGNAVEIHYALIEGINDTEQDAILLSNFLKDKDMNVKFLFYNEKPTLDIHASNKEKLTIFRRYLEKYNIKHEYYIPPGLDIGASCGQFLMDHYMEAASEV